MRENTRVRVFCSQLMDYGFLGERDSEEQVSPVLVIRERRHKMTWAMLVPREGTELPWIVKRAARFIDQLGHNTVTLRCDNEPATEAMSHTGDHRRQVHDPAPPQAPTRAPARATWPEQGARNTMTTTSRWMETVRTMTVRDAQTRQDQTAEGGSRRRETHVKSELSNQAPPNSTFREGSSGRRLLKDIQLPSPRKGHWTGPVRKQ